VHLLLPRNLSGGSGTRLWPMSRRLLPNNSYSGIRTDLASGHGTAAAGFRRALAPIVGFERNAPVLVAEQMREIGVKSEVQILEPSVVTRHLRSRRGAFSPESPSGRLHARAALRSPDPGLPAFHAAIATAIPPRRAVRSSLSESPRADRHRVRLYRARRARFGASTATGSSVRREDPTWRRRGAMSERTVFLEQRHVRSSPSAFWRSCSASAPRFWPQQRRRGKRANATLDFLRWIQLRSPPVRRIPSTMP